jgi:hypothetical protein
MELAGEGCLFQDHDVDVRGGWILCFGSICAEDLKAKEIFVPKGEESWSMDVCCLSWLAHCD